MSTAVSNREQTTAIAIHEGQTEFNDKQVAVLGQLGVSNADRGNLALFFHQSVKTGLDPFARQIYMIGRWANEWNPQTRQKEWTVKYTIQTGIDGYRLIARRAANASGVELAYGDALWCGRDGEWHDVWVWDNPPVASKFTVYRGKHAFTGVAVWREYVQTYKADGVEKPNSMWERMSSNQLAKCAEALALRKAFPQDLSGVYTDEEMGSDAASEEPAAQERTIQRETIRTSPVQQDKTEPEGPAEEPGATEQENGDDDVVDQPAEGETADEDTVPESEPAETPAADEQPAQEDPELTEEFVNQTTDEPEPPAADNPTAPDPSDEAPCTLAQRRQINSILEAAGADDSKSKSQALSNWLERTITKSKELTYSEASRFITGMGDE